MFTLKIETDNDAFGEDTDECSWEVSRLLTSVAKSVRAGEDHGACIDSNGNKVGWWTLIF